MKIEAKNNIAVLLMSSSLLFLGIFLAFWVKNLYQQEINRLKEKSSFVFINSIRKAESDFLKKEVLNLKVKRGKRDSLNIRAYSMKIIGKTSSDSQKAFEYIEPEGLNVESRMDITIDHRHTISNRQNNSKAFITFLTKSGHHIFIDSITTQYKDSIILQSINDIVACLSKGKGFTQTI